MQWPIPPFPTRVVAGTQVNLASSGSANTKGSYLTLLSGLSAPVGWINLGLFSSNLSAGDRAMIMDLAIGGAGSETIVAADIVCGSRLNASICFPLHVPAGATLRARIATTATSQVIPTAATGFMAEPESGISTPGRITSYGTVPASSSGTAVTPSGTANVKGSYVQLTASTARPIHALMVMVQGSTNTHLAASYAVDIAVGGSGSETVIIPDHSVAADTNEYLQPMSPDFYPLSLSIPAGVRLAARCAVTTGSVTTPVEVAVYGFTY
ncbi:hypothetical protein GCM10017559_08410 [Streptosporangium longisporum]|uniref:Uncharacterized protein n=1 Tax=Streptosporangium longisporum TaxID=46187 RepID=A0ABN3XRM2_9ACTN